MAAWHNEKAVPQNIALEYALLLLLYHRIEIFIRNSRNEDVIEIFASAVSEIQENDIINEFYK